MNPLLKKIMMNSFCGLCAALLCNSIVVNDAYAASNGNPSLIPIKSKSGQIGSANYEVHVGYTPNISVFLPKEKNFLKKAKQTMIKEDSQNYEAGVLALVEGKNGKWGIIDASGKFVLEPIYKKFTNVAPGVYGTKEKGKKVYFDAKGMLLAEKDIEALKKAPFENMTYEEKSKILTSFKGKKRYGFKNGNDEVVISPRFRKIESEFSDGVAYVLDEEHNRLAIDEQGKTLFEIHFDEIYPFEDGLAEYRCIVSSFSLNGLIANALEAAFQVRVFSDQERNLLKPTAKRGYINKAGEIIIDSKLDFVYEMTPWGTFIVNDDKGGFVNREGTYLVPMGEYEPKEISVGDGLLVMHHQKLEKDGLFSAIDGRKMMDFIYDDIDLLENDGIGVLEKGNRFLIQISTGEVLNVFKGDVKFTTYGAESFMWIHRAGKEYRIVDKMGQIVFVDKENMISEITPFYHGVSAVKVKGKWGLMDSKGMWILEPIYKNIYFQ